MVPEQTASDKGNDRLSLKTVARGLFVPSQTDVNHKEFTRQCYSVGSEFSWQQAPLGFVDDVDSSVWLTVPCVPAALDTDVLTAQEPAGSVDASDLLCVTNRTRTAQTQQLKQRSSDEQLFIDKLICNSSDPISGADFLSADRATTTEHAEALPVTSAASTNVSKNSPSTIDCVTATPCTRQFNEDVILGDLLHQQQEPDNTGDIELALPSASSTSSSNSVVEGFNASIRHIHSAARQVGYDQPENIRNTDSFNSGNCPLTMELTETEPDLNFHATSRLSVAAREFVPRLNMQGFSSRPTQQRLPPSDSRTVNSFVQQPSNSSGNRQFQQKSPRYCRPYNTTPEFSDSRLSVSSVAALTFNRGGQHIVIGRHDDCRNGKVDGNVDRRGAVALDGPLKQKGTVPKSTTVMTTEAAAEHVQQLLRDRYKVLVLLRGCPGCGKSTLARFVLVWG